MIFYGIKWKRGGLFQWQILKQPKLVQLGKVLCKWCTEVHVGGKLVTGSVITGKAKVFLLWIENKWQVHFLWYLALK